jgi:glycosyltransferase involved in cell wall biosynthesis
MVVAWRVLHARIPEAQTAVTERSCSVGTMTAMREELPAEDLVVDHLPARRRSLRIAVVTETYPPEVNGVSLTLARIVEGLRQRNHDIQLVRPRQAVDAAAAAAARGAADEPASTLPMEQVLTAGMPIPRYPHLRMGLPSGRFLKKLWSVERPDIVHIATEGPLGWSALRVASALQLPVSSDFRTNFHSYSKHYGLGWLHRPIMAYLRKFHNRTRCTMVPTAALGAELERHGFRNLEVVARGVDLAQFDPARRSEALRQSWGVGPDDLVVACVGRLAAEKNLDLLIDSFDAIAANMPSARLLLVGDGPLRETLQQRCPTAIFAGQRSGADLAAHYASADVFLFPSLTETFGNVTIEAMASGLPVVAYDYAAAAELIRPGVEGTLVPPGDREAFIRAARQLAAEDQPTRRERGIAARDRALALDWPHIVAQFEGVLEGVLRGAGQAPLGVGLVVEG